MGTAEGIGVNDVGTNSGITWRGNSKARIETLL